MASRLHQIARAGVVEDGENFFRESTDSRGLKAANALDGMQRSPLHLACWAGKAGMIKLLLKHRADCMATAQDGFTPLHFCSQAGCAEGCRLLLGAEAEVDAKLHKTKKTPLHLAAAKGHAEAVRALVQAGADPTSENSKGQTPLDLASTAEVKAALAGEPAPTATPPSSGGTGGAGGDDAPGDTIPRGAPGDTAVLHGGNGAPTEGEAVALAGAGVATAAAAAKDGVPVAGAKGDGAKQEDGAKQGEGGAKDREQKELGGEGGGDNNAPGSGRAPEGVAVGIEAGAEPGGVLAVPGSNGTGNGKDGASEGIRAGGGGAGGAEGVAMGGGASAEGGARKVGSLAERRRKRRKRAQEQAAGQTGGGGGVSLSHLDGDEGV